MIHAHNGRTALPGDRYNTMFKSDPGPCERPGCGRYTVRVVDHCHVHNLIRGEICYRCNGTPELKMGEWALRCPGCATGMLPFAVAGAANP